jgi:hypothetical protein
MGSASPLLASAGAAKDAAVASNRARFVKGKRFFFMGRGAFYFLSAGVVLMRRAECGLTSICPGGSSGRSLSQ